ncbi:hypothetical protein [Pectobacterium versatile]|uniref:hypothetical protein n=1 Tax=Pectobacterium versatile TaxID=2488639 RepID=UPI0010E87D18|nr:hypothetical protein EG334_09575 [Pectobacterium versatile]
MTPEEKEMLLIEKTCTLLAGRLANGQCKLSPSECIKEHFQDTYKALELEIKKVYIFQPTK